MKQPFSPEELHGAALIGREADDLPDEVPDELVARGVLPLGPRRLLLQCVGGRLVALVEADHELVPGRHAKWGVNRLFVIFLGCKKNCLKITPPTALWR